MTHYLSVQFPASVRIADLRDFADRLGLQARRLSDGTLRFIDPKNPPDNVRRLPARPVTTGPDLGGAA
jgi:hypothetical protein